MGAGLAAAGRPLGATVEVRLQRHGARRVEEQCQNDTVQILFLLLLLLLLYIFLFVGTQKWVTTCFIHFHLSLEDLHMI